MSTYANTIADAPAASDAPASGLHANNSLADTVDSQDSNIPKRFSYPLVAESTALSDAAAKFATYLQSVLETTVVTDLLNSVSIWLMGDSAAFSTTLSSALRGLQPTQDGVHLSDDMWVILALTIQDAVALSDSLGQLVRVLRAISEALQAADSLLSRRQATGLVADALAFLAENWTGASFTIAEQVTLATVVSVLRTTGATLQDFATVIDTPAHGVTIALLADDTVNFPDPPVGQVFNPSQLLNAIIEEQVQILIGWHASDGTWIGWTVNTTNQAVSNYAGWDFNSFTSFRGQPLGASTSQGICLLGGQADGVQAIQATLQSAVTDFGNSFLKRVKMAYIGVNSDGALYFQTLTDDNVERVYQLIPDAPGLHTERVQLARGVLSRYWSFTLQATGVDFRVDAVSLLPVTLERRI